MEKELFKKYQTGEKGLSSKEVEKRQKKFGANIIQQKPFKILSIFIRQLSNNPLIIILMTITIISFLTAEKTSSYYIFAIIIISIFLGFWNEYFAQRAIEKLLKKIALSTIVIRDDQKMDISVFQVVVGDIVLLAPGSIIPADMRLIATTNLQVDESALSGESQNVFKNPGNTVFMGTIVFSGSGTGVVVAIGRNTEFGKIISDISYLKPETVFQKGLSKYSSLLLWIMASTAILSFVANVILQKNILDTLLFSLAIAVGLTPELLPVIITVSLSHGAGKLAKKEVLIKQLVSIENLGNIDILCVDKTGTLTEGEIKVFDYLNAQSMRDEEILKLGLLCNSALVHHKIIGTPYDAALWNFALNKNPKLALRSTKIFEQPFDFSKRLMFSVIKKKGEIILIAKGAPEAIFALSGSHEFLKKRYENLSAQGFNVIALAVRKISQKKNYTWSDLEELDFAGFITFSDPAKKSAIKAINSLQKLNVEVKILTGDNELVAKKVCSDLGFEVGNIISGDDLDNLNDEELAKTVKEIAVFARINPEQKLKIIKSLQKMGYAVGYLGDGVNDVPALHSADVGISVNSAIDVAKDSAQVVLLQKDLNIVSLGIAEGRRVFSNTIKYILNYTGVNFGEMASLAGASFFMPFLPITPSQLLLQDLLYDISQLSITTDNVDPETIIKPKHWDLGFIKKYMIFFGILSAFFIALAFWFLISILHALPSVFRTGIFLEFMVSEMIVVFIIRTQRVPFYKSKPSLLLILVCFLISVFGFWLPYSPLSNSLGFTPLPNQFFIFLIFLSLVYLFVIEFAKKFLLKK